MTTAYTSLLGLALPVTGELSGTWGDTVNDSITSLLDTSVAGTTNVSTDTDVTLTTTTGAANQARQAILLFSGARTALRTVTAPAQSKIYTIINATTGGFSVKLVGAGPTTGVTIANGARTVVAWNGSDFVELSSPNSIILPGGTANGVTYLNGSKVLTSGSALTFDGTNLGVANGSVTAGNSGVVLVGRFSSSFPSPGAGYFRLRTHNTDGSNGGIAFDTLVSDTLTEQMRLTSTGLGIGTSSPDGKLDVAQAMINGSTSAFTSPHLALTATSSTDTTGFVGMTMATSDSANYGFSYGALRSNGGLGSLIWKYHFNSASGTELMRLDSYGNLGLGVTPSAWWSSAKALQIAGSTGFLGFSGVNGNIVTNTYYDGSNYRYLATSAAFLYEQSAGHKWSIAPSGTAGDAITFTQAATLDANGNFLVGTTSASNSGIGSGFQVQNLSGNGTTINIGHPSSASDGYSYALFSYNNGIIGSIGQSGTTAVAYNTSSDYRLKNITGPVTTSGAYIDNLNPVEGTWKADGSIFVGLIAHEVQEVSRTKVATGTKDGAEMQAMDYSNSELIANLIAEIKSLRQRVATLEAK